MLPEGERGMEQSREQCYQKTGIRNPKAGEAGLLGSEC